MSDPTDTGGVLIDRQIARDDASLRADNEYLAALEDAVEHMYPDVIRAAWNLAKVARIISSWKDWQTFAEGTFCHGLSGDDANAYLRAEAVVNEHSGEYPDIALFMARFAGIEAEIESVIKEAGE